MATNPNNREISQLKGGVSFEESQANIKKAEEAQKAAADDARKWVTLPNGQKVLDQEYIKRREAERDQAEATVNRGGTSSYYSSPATSPTQIYQDRVNEYGLTIPNYSPNKPTQGVSTPTPSGTTSDSGQYTFGDQATTAAQKLLNQSSGDSLTFGANATAAAKKLLEVGQNGQPGSPATTPTGGQATPTAPGASTAGAPNTTYGGQAGTYASTSQSQLDALKASGDELAKGVYTAAESERELGLDQVYSRTNLADLGFTPEVWASMNIQQKEEALSQNGYSLSDAEIQRIRAGGDSQIQNLRIQQDYMMNKYDSLERQLEQSFQRQLSSQEKVNAQNDVAMRALANRFGSAGETMTSNVSVMQKRQEGLDIIKQMETDYGNQLSAINNERNYYMSTITNNINSIEQGLQDAMTERFTALQEAAMGYIRKGVTNVAELNKLLYQNGLDYYNSSQDMMKTAYQMFENERNYATSLMQWQKSYTLQMDSQLMTSTGFVYQGGQQVIDQYGQPVATFARTQWASEEDRSLSATTGYMYRGGQMLINQQTGQPIPTFSREQYAADVAFRDKSFERGVYESDRAYNFDVEKFNTDVEQWGMQYALQAQAQNFSQAMQMSEEERQQFAYDVERSAQDIANNPYLQKYLKASDVMAMGVFTNNNVPVIDNVINAIQTGLEKAGKDPAFQCVQFVRSILPDLPFLGSNDSFKNKVNKLVNDVKNGVSKDQMPQVGDAVVLDWGDYGHLGFVGDVNMQDRTFTMIDYNGAGGRQQPSRVTISMDDPKLGGYWRSPNLQSGSSQDAQISQIADDIMNPFGGLTLGDIPQAMRSAVSQVVTQRRQAAFDSGDMSGIISASAGGRPLTQTQETRLVEAQNVLSQLNNLEDTLAKVDTGPITGLYRNANPYDVDAAALKAQIIRLVPSLARGTFGEVGVLTDTDINRYASTIPNLNTPAGAKTLLMTATRDLVKDGIRRNLQTMAAGGTDVSGFSYLIPQIEDNAIDYNSLTSF